MSASRWENQKLGLSPGKQLVRVQFIRRTPPVPSIAGETLRAKGLSKRTGRTGWLDEIVIMVADGNAPRHNPFKPGKGLVGNLPLVGCRVAVLHNVPHLGHEDDILLFGVLPNPLRLIVKIFRVCLSVELSVRQHDDRKRFLVSGRAASKYRQGGNQKGEQQARIHVHISLSCQSRRQDTFYGNSTQTIGSFRNKNTCLPLRIRGQKCRPEHS